MDDALLPIGMFSRASSLSIKALRAYHEAGMLVPARVDPQTGYRAYSVDQLADAAIVSRLRSLDVPLEKVALVLRSRDPEVTRMVLTEHEVTMRARLADTERIVAELQSQEAPTTHTPVHVRHDDGAHTVRMSATLPADELWDWLNWAYTRLDAVLAGASVSASGPHSALYRPEIAEDDIEPVEAFIPIAAPFRVPSTEPDVGIGEVPASQIAVLVHTGDYDSIGDTYRTLGAWVARNAEHANERIRERYLVSSDDTNDPAAYRTEICWPILHHTMQGAST